MCSRGGTCAGRRSCRRRGRPRPPPACHLPFAVIPFGYDDLVTAMKLAAAALTTVPMVLAWAIARRLGASVVGSALMAFVPTYVSRLSFAFLPALFGHAVDIAFLFWLAGNLERIRERRISVG